MEKSHIISEIQRTAKENGGVALGTSRFEAVTGIKSADWFGIFWARWGDAVREAGFQPNKVSLENTYEKEVLLRKYAELAKELGRLPGPGDLLLKRRSDSSFPNRQTFIKRIGKIALFNQQLAEFCRSRNGFEDVLALCDSYTNTSQSEPNENEQQTDRKPNGYVYLLKHGSRREYKIGRTNNKLRREGEISLELPEKVEPIHVIETDDPAGIENYWHRRFAEKRLKNEWFSLSAEDVRAFKRWRRIV